MEIKIILISSILLLSNLLVAQHVGIGTENPSQRLELAGGGNSLMENLELALLLIFLMMELFLEIVLKSTMIMIS